MQGDLELQHAGIQFVSIDGMPRPRNVGGPDPLAPGLVAVQERAAATAACLLVRRDAFVAVGGFDPAYVYGYEDVDLCLRLRAEGGRILVDGRAVLWHDESSTRRRDRSTATRVQQRENRAVFYERWGRSLFRDVLRDRLDGRRFLSAEPLSCAIVIPGGPRPEAVALRDALARKGWAAELLVAGGIRWPGTAEVVVVADPRVDVRELPRHVLKIAWIAEAAEAWAATPWIDDFDVRVVAPADGSIEAVADAIETALRSWIEARRVGILVDVDVQLARDLEREFERRGFPTTLYFRPEWRTAVSTREDLVIHLSEGDADRVDEILRLVDDLQPAGAV